MSNFRVLIGFSDYSDEGLLSKGRVIEDKMTGNANFPSPDPSVEVLSNILNKFELDLTASDGGRGGVNATAIKNQSRIELTKVMQNIGLYVQINGKDDYLILLSSGYDIKATATIGTEPATPINISLADGSHSGECEVKFDKVKNATMYEIRYSSTPNVPASWITLPATPRTRNTISGIAHATELYVQVRSINSHGFSEWSNESDLLVR